MQTPTVAFESIGPRWNHNAQYLSGTDVELIFAMINTQNDFALQLFIRSSETCYRQDCELTRKRFNNRIQQLMTSGNSVIIAYKFFDFDLRGTAQRPR